MQHDVQQQLLPTATGRLMPDTKRNFQRKITDAIAKYVIFIRLQGITHFYIEQLICDHIAGYRFRRNSIGDFFSALNNQKRCVVVHGPAGVGKSAILKQFVKTLSAQEQQRVVFVHAKSSDEITHLLTWSEISNSSEPWIIVIDNVNYFLEDEDDLEGEARNKTKTFNELLQNFNQSNFSGTLVLVCRDDSLQLLENTLKRQPTIYSTYEVPVLSDDEVNQFLNEKFDEAERAVLRSVPMNTRGTNFLHIPFYLALLLKQKRMLVHYDSSREFLDDYVLRLSLAGDANNLQARLLIVCSRIAYLSIVTGQMAVNPQFSDLSSQEAIRSLIDDGILSCESRHDAGKFSLHHDIYIDYCMRQLLTQVFHIDVEVRMSLQSLVFFKSWYYLSKWFSQHLQLIAPYLTNLTIYSPRENELWLLRSKLVHLIETAELRGNFRRLLAEQPTVIDRRNNETILILYKVIFSIWLELWNNRNNGFFRVEAIGHYGSDKYLKNFRRITILWFKLASYLRIDNADIINRCVEEISCPVNPQTKLSQSVSLNKTEESFLLLLVDLQQNQAIYIQCPKIIIFAIKHVTIHTYEALREDWPILMHYSNNNYWAKVWECLGKIEGDLQLPEDIRQEAINLRHRIAKALSLSIRETSNLDQTRRQELRDLRDHMVLPDHFPTQAYLLTERGISTAHERRNPVSSEEAVIEPERKRYRTSSSK
ncbi:MAG: ATP-binding protein [Gammaproteobacteria bacterium]